MTEEQFEELLDAFQCVVIERTYAFDAVQEKLDQAYADKKDAEIAEARKHILTEFRRLRGLGIVPCRGCGLPITHKMCVAWGTPVYCDPDHPDWGNEHAIQENWGQTHLAAIEYARVNPGPSNLD